MWLVSVCVSSSIDIVGNLDTYTTAVADDISIQDTAGCLNVMLSYLMQTQRQDS